MLLHIPKVLTPEELTEVRDALGRAEWTDGRETVGLQGAQVKRNEQLPEASPVRQALGAKILAALAATLSSSPSACHCALCRPGSIATKAAASTDFMWMDR